MTRHRFFLALFVLAQPLYASSASSPFLEKLTHEQNAQAQINLFLSIFPDPATTYPTLNAIDNAVTFVFDTTLGLPSSLLDSLRRFYAFLKETAVNEHLATVLVPQGKKQVPLLVALENATEQLEQAQHYNDKAGITTWQTTLANLNKLKTTEAATLAATIVDRCRTTKIWQNHLKIFLANSFAYELQLLENVNQDEIKMFSFIPQFETAYYSDIYKKFRNDAEYVRIFLVMTDTLRQRVLSQCTDWQNITDPAALYEAIETFKQGEFYLFAKQFETISLQKGTTPLQHVSLLQTKGGPLVSKGYRNYLSCTQGDTPTIIPALGMDPLFSITDNIPSLTSFGSFLLTEGTITPPKGAPYPGLIPTKNFKKLFVENPDGNGHMPTPLFVELLSFTAINLLNQNNSYLFNAANLADTMQRLSSLQGNPQLTQFPNLIFYQPEDQLYLEDINSLTQLIITPSGSGAAAPAGFFSSLWDDIKSAFERLSHILKSGFEKIGGVLWHALKTAGNFIVNIDEKFGHYVQTGLSFFANGVAYVAHQTASGIENAGDAIEAGLETTGEGFVTGIENTGYGLTVAANEMAWATAQASKYMSYGIEEAEKMVNEITKISEEGFAIASGVLGKIVATITQDPQLGDDISGLLDSVVDLVLDARRDIDDFFIEYYGDMFKLASEAVMVLATSAVAVVTNDENALGNVWNQFAQDIVTSILSAVSICGKFVTDALKNVMVGVGYLVASLTDLVTDLGEAFTAFGVLLVTLNPEEAKDSMLSVRHDMYEHRRLISAIVGTVLMIAVTVATLGTAGPMMAVLMTAMTVGMMVPALIGANQQDMDTLSELSTQEAFLADFTTYVNQSEPAQASLQSCLTHETALRLQEQVINADRGLVYYENYVNNSLNSTRALQAYQQSSFYNLLSIPDTTNYPQTGILPADPGYTYGIKTGRMDLNPSQGLRLYTSQRGTFAQEIATLPAPLKTPEQVTNTFSASTPTSSLVQHFITQKDLANFTSSDNTVTVRWRIIYESPGDFYIGIYLNQNYLDTGFLNFLHHNFEQTTQTYGLYDPQSFNKAWEPLRKFNRYLFNFDYFAQAFVCYRNSSTLQQPALGVYQHLGQGFISENNQPTQEPWFERGAWYTMTATRLEKEIKVVFTKEDQESVSWTRTIPIQPLPDDMVIPYDNLMMSTNYYAPQRFTGSFGMITSGAAVEYEFLTPKQTTTVSASRKTANNNVTNLLSSLGCPASELQREQQWLKALETNVKPTFGSWNLEAYSDLTIAQGVYVYSTTSTNLGLKAPLSDFVVALQNPPGASAISTIGLPLLNSPAQVGQPITSSTSLLVSLVTGNCYDQQGALQLTYPDSLAAFQQQNSTVPVQLLRKINAATQAFYAREVGPFIFENVTITGSLPALKDDVYVYTCPSFTKYLSGLDYLVFIALPAGGLPGTSQTLMPLSPTNSINSAISLVTGTMYSLTAQDAVQNALPASSWKTIALTPSGRSFPQTISTYQPFLDKKTLTALQNQTKAYQAAKEAAEKVLLAAELNPPPPPPPPPLPPAPPVPSLANLNLLLQNSSTNSSGGGFSFSG